MQKKRLFLLLFVCTYIPYSMPSFAHGGTQKVCDDVICLVLSYCNYNDSDIIYGIFCNKHLKKILAKAQSQYPQKWVLNLEDSALIKKLLERECRKYAYRKAKEHKSRYHIIAKEYLLGDTPVIDIAKEIYKKQKEELSKNERKKAYLISKIIRKITSVMSPYRVNFCNNNKAYQCMFEGALIESLYNEKHIEGSFRVAMLKSLYIGALEDIEILRKYKWLEELSLYDCKCQNFRFLAWFPKLRVLRVRHCSIKHPTMQKCNAAEKYYFENLNSDTHWKEARTYDILSRNIGSNERKHIALTINFNCLKHLVELDLEGTKITNYKSLKYLKKLEKLYLPDNTCLTETRLRQFLNNL